MLRELLHAVWSELVEGETTTGPLAGRRLGIDGDVAAFAAVDMSGGWHLLIASDVEQLHGVAQTRGLLVDLENLVVGDNAESRYIRMSCTVGAMNDSFIAVAADVLIAIERGAEPHRAVPDVIRAWRWFWGVDPLGLDGDAQVGLFGELWFLIRWMGRLRPSLIDRWAGPLGSRHDFQWAATSVEVKTCVAATDAGVVHRVNGLDQLDDTEGRRLFLFSLQITDDPLAANSLTALVSQVETALSEHPDHMHAFRERLAAVGYSPAHADRYGRRFRIVREGLYEVDGNFPRLTLGSFVGGLPTGVGSILYTIDLAACAPWLRARTPIEGETVLS